jgi:hypothetical protein
MLNFDPAEDILVCAEARMDGVMRRNRNFWVEITGHLHSNRNSSLSASVLLVF